MLWFGASSEARINFLHTLVNSFSVIQVDTVTQLFVHLSVVSHITVQDFSLVDNFTASVGGGTTGIGDG
jgi:hypothetical protein